MASNFKPYNTLTVDEFIESGKRLIISESSIAFKTIIDDVAITYYNVLTKYVSVVNRYTEIVTLSDEELYKYRCKPNLYCYDIYGTPELTSSFLYINNMVSITDFKKKTFKRFTSNILDILNELMIINSYDITKNRLDNNIE